MNTVTETPQSTFQNADYGTMWTDGKATYLLCMTGAGAVAVELCGNLGLGRSQWKDPARNKTNAVEGLQPYYGKIEIEVRASII